ncbi:MAG: hypothetical protein QNK36_10835, partial [Colwellia sp.]|nr:hypothetical protein [Colwellia sp.]
TDTNRIIGLSPINDVVLVDMLTNVLDETGRYEYQNEKYINEDYQAVKPKSIDLLNFDLAPFEFKDIIPVASTSFTPFTDNTPFVNKLNEMKQDLDDVVKDETERDKFKSGAVFGAAASLTVGFISWVLRAGALMASFMSITALWRQFDPLPILGSDPTKSKKKDSSDEDIAEDKNVEDIFTEEDSNE